MPPVPAQLDFGVEIVITIFLHTGKATAHYKAFLSWRRNVAI